MRYIALEDQWSHKSGDQLPEYGLFFQRPKHSRICRPHLVGQAGDLKVIHSGSAAAFGRDVEQAGRQLRSVLRQCKPASRCVCLTRRAAPKLHANDLPARTGDVWHGLISPRRAGPGTHYDLLRARPKRSAKWSSLRSDGAFGRPLCSRTVGAAAAALARHDRAFEWQGDRPPTIPWRDSIIYELHVKGFTQLHPAVPVNGAENTWGCRWRRSSSIEVYRRDGSGIAALSVVCQRTVLA